MSAVSCRPERPITVELSRKEFAYRTSRFRQNSFNMHVHNLQLCKFIATRSSAASFPSKSCVFSSSLIVPTFRPAPSRRTVAMFWHVKRKVESGKVALA